MQYNIVFEDGRKLSTYDFKTAFQACDMPDRVAAVTYINPQTNEEEVLWGEMPHENECEVFIEDENAIESDEEAELPWLIKVRTVGPSGFKIQRFRCTDEGYRNGYADLKTQFLERNRYWDDKDQITKVFFFHRQDGEFTQVKVLDFMSHEEL